MSLNELLDEFIKSQNIMEEDLTKKDIFRLLFLFIKKNIYEELMKKELEHFLKLENEAKEGDEEKNYYIRKT